MQILFQTDFKDRQPYRQEGRQRQAEIDKTDAHKHAQVQRHIY